MSRAEIVQADAKKNNMEAIALAPWCQPHFATMWLGTNLHLRYYLFFASACTTSVLFLMAPNLIVRLQNLFDWEFRFVKKKHEAA
jgi:hypothetical protein